MKELHQQMDRDFPSTISTLRGRMKALVADFESFAPEARERVGGLKEDQV